MLHTHTFLKSALAALVVFVVGDYLWHNVLLLDFYNSRLDALGAGALGSSFPPFIIGFEVIAALGCSYFVLKTSHSMGQAVLHGAFLGLMMVAAINFVNHSLLPAWDVAIVVIDTTWGVALGCIGGAAIWLMRKA